MAHATEERTQNQQSKAQAEHAQTPVPTPPQGRHSNGNHETMGSKVTTKETQQTQSKGNLSDQKGQAHSYMKTGQQSPPGNSNR
jgi:hypothetical protein